MPPPECSSTIPPAAWQVLKAGEVLSPVSSHVQFCRSAPTVLATNLMRRWVGDRGGQADSGCSLFQVDEHCTGYNQPSG